MWLNIQCTFDHLRYQGHNNTHEKLAKYTTYAARRMSSWFTNGVRGSGLQLFEIPSQRKICRKGALVVSPSSETSGRLIESYISNTSKISFCAVTLFSQLIFHAPQRTVSHLHHSFHLQYCRYDYKMQTAQTFLS